MANWKYTLKCGKKLREAISNDDAYEVLRYLAEAWKEIHSQFPDEYDEFDLQGDLDEISEISALGEDYDLEVEDDDVDWLLSDLYDYCDATRIWIDM